MASQGVGGTGSRWAQILGRSDFSLDTDLGRSEETLGRSGETRTRTRYSQTYFAIRGGKAKRVDAASVVEAASVCGGKSHFAAKLRICPPRHAAIRDMMPSRCES
ncbi:hypothetical protein DPMN_065094 [Dreissena polymorpha]|uniref:Uncharacterized protein n=1 Tax=Dreissena polymorpha TaxID=45954 RepID=A0A9D4CDG0_DREPO|nr:hypothetical protein DPMN_065094 [Dreissena polymorpha]